MTRPRGHAAGLAPSWQRWWTATEGRTPEGRRSAVAVRVEFDDPVEPGERWLL